MDDDNNQVHNNYQIKAGNHHHHRKSKKYCELKGRQEPRKEETSDMVTWTTQLWC